MKFPEEATAECQLVRNVCADRSLVDLTLSGKAGQGSVPSVPPDPPGMVKRASDRDHSIGKEESRESRGRSNWVSGR